MLGMADRKAAEQVFPEIIALLLGADNRNVGKGLFLVHSDLANVGIQDDPILQS